MTIKFARVAGWTVIVLSVMIMLLSGTLRMAAMTQNPPSTDAFDVRYVQNLLVAFIHIVPGLLFLSLAPLQFIKRIRQRHIGFHRGLGRVLVGCALISGVFALVAGFRFPAFGGIATQSATVFFGAIFLFSLAKAIWHIRRKEVRLHREWMIRTFALAMGVASIRVFLGLVHGISGFQHGGGVRHYVLAWLRCQSTGGGSVDQSDASLTPDPGKGTLYLLLGSRKSPNAYPTFDEEEINRIRYDLAHATVRKRSNNSSKPTPLRGAA